MKVIAINLVNNEVNSIFNIVYEFEVQFYGYALHNRRHIPIMMEERLGNDIVIGQRFLLKNMKFTNGSKYYYIGINKGL